MSSLTFLRSAIHTRYDPPPIPYRGCDWHATFEGYDEGDPMGYGQTEQEAIDALIEQVTE